MTKELTDRPFYFRPPWNILFDIQRLRRIRPWEIKIAFLLTTFLEEMNLKNEIDFRASGMVLDSSAEIYLMKSKLLLKLEEPPPPAEPKPEFLPPPLVLPLRFELTTTSISNLLEALDEALRGEKIFKARPRLESTLIPPAEVIPSVSIYIMEMEDEIKRLYRKILRLSEEDRLVTFSMLISGLDELEKVKTFIILLFMAQRGEVTLWQEMEFGKIYINPVGGAAGGRNE
ncbi:MAG: hypothetical protein ACE5NN_03055 [Candidatus Bathyarchaeia archaeon]